MDNLDNSSHEHELKLNNNQTILYNEVKNTIEVHDSRDEEVTPIPFEQHGTIKSIKVIRESLFSVFTLDNEMFVYNQNLKLVNQFDFKSPLTQGKNVNGYFVAASYDHIALFSSYGKLIYSKEINIDSKKDIQVNDQLINIYQNEKLEIFDLFSGNLIYKFNERIKINAIKFIDDRIFIYSENTYSLWDKEGHRITNFSFSINFDSITKISENAFSFISRDENETLLRVVNKDGEHLAKTNASREFIEDYSYTINTSKKLDDHKNNKSNILSFPHLNSPINRRNDNLTQIIAEQEIDLSDEDTKNVWNFFNRPLFGPINSLLKTEENATKKYKRNLNKRVDNVKEELKILNKELEEAQKSILANVAPGLIIFIIGILGVGFGISAKSPELAGLMSLITLLGVIFLFLHKSKKSFIEDKQADKKKKEDLIDIYEKITNYCDIMIKGINQYRQQLIRQFPFLRNKELFDGQKVQDHIKNVTSTTIYEMALYECGLTEDDIIVSSGKPIILPVWSKIQSQKIKGINEHNLNSFWFTKSGKILFAVQHIQFIFLTKDKLDVFNTHYDFIQNKFYAKETHTFYYKDVTNITKKYVDRTLFHDDETKATEINLKVSSGDYIEITMFNDETFSDLQESLKSPNQESESYKSLEDLEEQKRQIEIKEYDDIEEKEDELENINALIEELKREDGDQIQAQLKDEFDYVNNAIKNIRSQINKYKE